MCHTNTVWTRSPFTSSWPAQCRTRQISLEKILSNCQESMSPASKLCVGKMTHLHRSIFICLWIWSPKIQLSTRSRRLLDSRLSMCPWARRLTIQISSRPNGHPKNQDRKLSICSWTWKPISKVSVRSHRPLLSRLTMCT